MDDEALMNFTATLMRARPHEELRPHPGGLVLEVTEGQDQGSTFRPQGQRIVIGRGGWCDVQLSDSSVSGRHLELSLSPTTVVLKDLGSRNGTWVGKARIETAVLANGAEFKAGRCGLRLVSVSMRNVPVSQEPSFGDLLGQSEEMRALFAYLDRLAPTPLNVVLLGETGTGKSEVARALHLRSGRSGRFVIRNCSAFPSGLAEAELFGHVRGAFSGATQDREGAFAAADQGTLFLDEVADLAPELQSKLLTVLDRGEVLPVGGDRVREVDVRVIAATNANLEGEVEAGRFRADLYHRLVQVPPVRIPSLRERREDIPLLAAAFLDDVSEELNRPLAFSENALAALRRKTWEGNVRQLKNVVMTSAYLTQHSEIDVGDLIFSPRARVSAPRNADDSALYDQPLRVALEEFQRRYCEHLLERTEGDLDGAAEHAGYTRKGLRELLGRLGLG